MRLPLLQGELSHFCDCGDKIIRALLPLLTHKKGTDYFAYIEKIKRNPVAAAVKLADLEHNMDQSRFAGCAQVSQEQLNKRQNKYSRAKKIICSRAEEE